MKKVSRKINIGIFGFGNMGKAIFTLLKKNNNFKFFAQDLIKIKKQQNLEEAKNIEDLYNKSDILFLCIKPQDFLKLKKIDFIKNSRKQKIIISIMAGTSIQKIEKVFSGKIIRTMPNLTLQIGEGVIGWYTKEKLTKKENKLIMDIFNNFGFALKVKKEKMLNAITALSGSGPAYVFLFFNALMQSAIKLGFTKKEALGLVKNTIKGSISFIEQDENKLDLEDLIKKISSKGGTTEAALKTLNKKEFIKKWEKAINSSCRRSLELGS